MKTVWLVIMQGVYEHGVYYVAETEEDAKRFTEEYAPDRDGYHEWAIRPMKIGAPPEVVSDPALLKKWDERYRHEEKRKIVAEEL